MGEVLVGTLGSIAGSKTAQLIGGGDDAQPDVGEQITQLVNGMNNTLNDYLNRSLSVTQNYTDQAINQSTKYLGQANTNLTNYLAQAQRQAQMNSLYGQNINRAYLQPTIQAGNTALDAYMDSLGLKRPVVGTNAVQQALTDKALKEQSIGFLNSQYGGNLPTNPGSAPIAPTQQAAYQPSEQEIRAYITQNSNQGRGMAPGGLQIYTGMNSPWQESRGPRMQAPSGWSQQAFNEATMYTDINKIDQNSPIYKNAMLGLTIPKQQAADAAYQQQQQAYNAQNQQYQSNLANYNQYSDALNNINANFNTSPMQDSILNAYQAGYFNK